MLQRPKAYETMTVTPMLPETVQEFISTLQCGLDFMELDVVENFLCQYVQDKEGGGCGLSLCQLDVKKSSVSIKRSRTTEFIVMADGLHFLGGQMMPFSHEQQPHKLAALMLAAILSKHPITPPPCPHCLEEHAQTC